MTAPLPVAVTRPKRSLRDAIVRMVAAFAVQFIKAWALMALIPATGAHWHPGYWQSLALVYVVAVLWQTNEYMGWTHEAKS